MPSADPVNTIRRKLAAGGVVTSGSTEWTVRAVGQLSTVDELRAVEADPSDPATHALLGFVDDLAGRNDEALSSYRAALYLDPALFEVRLLLADCLGRLGHADRAAREYRDVLAALEAGCESFESSFGELGGCPVPAGATGNIATEDLVSMLGDEAAWWDVARATPAPYLRPPYGSYDSEVLAAALQDHAVATLVVSGNAAA